MTREWRRKPLKSLKTDSDPPAPGYWSGELIRRIPHERAGREIWNAAGPAETQRPERAINALVLNTTWKANCGGGKFIFI